MKYRIHLRHSGSGPLRRPGYSHGDYLGNPYHWNIYLGGRLFIAVRPLKDEKPLLRRVFGQGDKAGFLDLGMGRAMLKYKREEDACPWPGTDHYDGICNCKNKRQTHPRFLVTVREDDRDPNGRPRRFLRAPQGNCSGCGVDETTWCTEDCTRLDPMDYR